MTLPDRTTRYAAFGWMLLLGVIGGLVLVGEALDDPGGWRGLLLTAAWLAPLAGLAWLGLRRADSARLPLVAATAIVAVFTVADATLDLVPRGWGPVAVVAVFTVAEPLAFLGLSAPFLAGRLLLVLGAAQMVATLVIRAGSGGPVIGGSSVVLVGPVLIGALLFLVAGRHSAQAPHHRPPAGHVAAG